MLDIKYDTYKWILGRRSRRTRDKNKGVAVKSVVLLQFPEGNEEGSDAF